MAESLEVDGELALPLVATIAARLGPTLANAQHVLDVGCGPGVITCALAAHAPSAAVTGLDTAGPLLQRLRERATHQGVADRVTTVEGNLEADLPDLSPADVVWAAMVVHHVADRVATLRRLHDALRPGGTLVLVEFGGQPTVLPPGDPAEGAWQRMQDAAEANLVERLGFDVPHHAWAPELEAAGFTVAGDGPVEFLHPAPLGAAGGRWLPRHARRGIQWAGEALSPADASALDALATSVELGERPDLAIRAERRVVLATRPG